MYKVRTAVSYRLIEVQDEAQEQRVAAFQL